MKDWRKDKIANFLMYFISSTMVMFGLFYPVGLVHEMGHGIICVTHNGSFPWNWVFLHLTVICTPFPTEVKEISFAMGGIFGIIGSLVPLAVFKFLRKHKFILNGFLGMAFMELGYAIFETKEHEQYISNALGATVPIAIMAIFAIGFFTIYIDKIKKYCTRKKSN